MLMRFDYVLISPVFGILSAAPKKKERNKSRVAIFLPNTRSVSSFEKGGKRPGSPIWWLTKKKAHFPGKGTKSATTRQRKEVDRTGADLQLSLAGKLNNQQKTLSSIAKHL